MRQLDRDREGVARLERDEIDKTVAVEIPATQDGFVDRRPRCDTSPRWYARPHCYAVALGDVDKRQVLPRTRVGMSSADHELAVCAGDDAGRRWRAVAPVDHGAHLGRGFERVVVGHGRDRSAVGLPLLDPERQEHSAQARLGNRGAPACARDGGRRGGVNLRGAVWIELDEQRTVRRIGAEERGLAVRRQHLNGERIGEGAVRGRGDTGPDQIDIELHARAEGDVLQQPVEHGRGRECGLRGRRTGRAAVEGEPRPACRLSPRGG